MKLEANLFILIEKNFKAINLLARSEEANTANRGAYGVTSLKRCWKCNLQIRTNKYWCYNNLLERKFG